MHRSAVASSILSFGLLASVASLASPALAQAPPPLPPPGTPNQPPPQQYQPPPQPQ